MTTQTQHPKAALIGALLRKAEKASTPQEAEAYMDKAQHLATEYQIDLELARLAHSAKMAPPVPTCKVIEIGIAGKRGLFTYVKLFSAIARANEVKCDVSQNSTHVWAYGFDTDIETVQELYNSLIVQMVAASTAYVAGRTWEGELARTNSGDYRRVTATTARISFQEGYAFRIGQRLQAAKETAAAAVTTSEGTSGALVLAGRELAVRDYYSRTSDARGAYRGGRSNRAKSSSAIRQGVLAAERARLGRTAAIGGQRVAISA